MSALHSVRRFASQSINVDIKNVTKRWNSMASWYSKLLKSFMAPTTDALIQHLYLNDNLTNKNENEPFKLLDVAIGDGYNSTRIIKELIATQSSFEYYGNDIAEEMIDIANSVINEDMIISNMLKNTDISDTKYQINISVGNGEDLKNFEQDTFDRYLSSLSLMLTGNASNMINESYRVLKPNGISAWSIWGDKYKGTLFHTFDSIFKDINKELDIEQTEERSNYYLSDDFDNTLNMFKSAGFSGIYYWDMNVAIPLLSLEEWITYYLWSPAFISSLKQCKDEQQQQKIKQILIDGMSKEWEKYLVNQNKALIHNNICIIARK